MTQNDKPELFVVDGSNIATEGRSQPNLEQLNEAVAAFRDEYPAVKVTVVVDATFGHRIAKKEVKAFDKAIAANELVTPPAGAVGRGDAFILAIADKANAGVFSNDSFQEFHGEYEWLFETGRLIGAKPVPNVGWVFVDRNPVRGRKSREAVKAAKVADQGDSSPTESKEKAQRRVRKRRAGASGDAAPKDESSRSSTDRSKGDEPANDQTSNDQTSNDQSSNDQSSNDQSSNGQSTKRGSRRGSSRRKSKSGASDAPKSGDDGSRSSTSGSTTPKSGQVNDPGAFFDFVEHHQPGSWVTAVVDSYASHGAYARIGDVLIYIPLRLMADPAPSSARKMLTTGEEIEVVIVAYVPDRLSIDAALPAMAPKPADGQAEQATPVEAADEVDGGESAQDRASKEPAPRRRSKKRAASGKAAGSDATPVKRSAAKKKAARKSTAKKAPAKKAAAKKAPAKKTAGRKAPAKKAVAKKAPAKKAPAKKAPAKKAAAKKAPAKKKAAAKRRAPARKKKVAAPPSGGDGSS